MRLIMNGMRHAAGRAVRCLDGIRPLPGTGTVHMNFCIHTEVIYDDRTYEALRSFAKGFRDLTGARIAVCVSTPVCPLVSKALAERGMGEDAFARRVVDLGRFAELGYHGHFYPAGTTTFDHMRREWYDRALVLRQIGEEMDWFGKIGVVPRLYIAGCWFLMEDIVLELERRGFAVDMSIRRGKSDTFGGVYLADGALPRYGRPFILPPSRNIVEIMSIFGPVMSPLFMKGHLSGYLERDDSDELSFIFPLHDWDIPRYYRAIWSNTKALDALKGRVRWTEIMEMRDRFLAAEGRGL